MNPLRSRARKTVDRSDPPSYARGCKGM